MTDKVVTHFVVAVTGQIESCEMLGHDNLFCRYTIQYGTDWQMLEGQREGISQISRKASGQNKRVVWNFPIDVSFKSTNAFGWPQLVVTVAGMDSFGREVIRGYGCVHLPLSPGRYTKYIRLFRPMSSTPLNSFLSSLPMFGTPPEFVNSQFVADAEGREAVRVTSDGIVKAQFNIITKDMAKFGYSDGLGKTTFQVGRRS